MTQELPEAFGFKKDEVVQMLVETSGLDADDNELTFPIGAVAIIDRIKRLKGSQGIAFTLAVEGKIVNVFDEGDGLPAKKFFEPVLTERDDIKCPFTRADVKDADTYTLPPSCMVRILKATIKLAIFRTCSAPPGVS
jgi:hypothetical protein